MKRPRVLPFQSTLVTSPSGISQGSELQVPNDRNVQTLTRHRGLLVSGVWPFHDTGPEVGTQE